jgi:hypothetical protein
VGRGGEEDRQAHEPEATAIRRMKVLNAERPVDRRIEVFRVDNVDPERMSTLQEIEDAIRALPKTDREKLANDSPEILPELNGDAEWRRIINDTRPRPALSKLIDEVDEQFRKDPSAFPLITDEEFDKHS